MKVRDFIPPAVWKMAGAIVKTFASDWLRGRDFDDDLSGKRTHFTQPYAQSAWVRAAVNHVAGEVASRPVVFYKGDVEHEDAALAAWWAAPALGPRTLAGTQPRLTIDQVLFDLASWERLEGEFFICFGDDWLIDGGRRLSALSSQLSTLSPFLIANPQRMQAVVMGGELAGWRYNDAGGRQLTCVPQQVIHGKSFNP